MTLICALEDTFSKGLVLSEYFFDASVLLSNSFSAMKGSDEMGRDILVLFLWYWKIENADSSIVFICKLELTEIRVEQVNVLRDPKDEPDVAKEDIFQEECD